MLLSEVAPSTPPLFRQRPDNESVDVDAALQYYSFALFGSLANSPAIYNFMATRGEVFVHRTENFRW